MDNSVMGKNYFKSAQIHIKKSPFKTKDIIEKEGNFNSSLRQSSKYD